MNNSHKTFNERCYELLNRIPPGKVTTYAEIARALNTRAWRAVGSAMAKNQNLVTVPCHRVVRSNGEIGEYAMGADRKASLLCSEGVEVTNGKVINFTRYFHKIS